MNYLPVKEQPQNEERTAYEAPAIIYEGTISTRAGSPVSNPSSVNDIDPAELFND
jgi:hypothetical protein